MVGDGSPFPVTEWAADGKERGDWGGDLLAEWRVSRTKDGKTETRGVSGIDPIRGDRCRLLFSTSIGSPRGTTEVEESHGTFM